MLQVCDLHINDSIIVAFLQSSIYSVAMFELSQFTALLVSLYHTSGIAHTGSYTSYSCYLLYIVHFFLFLFEINT